MKEFKINDYLTLRLQDYRTFIYIAGKKFRQCKFLLLNIPADEIKLLDEVQSIDEATERLNNSLERDDQTKITIDSKTEFWAHCSNLQVWYEHNYDTRLLHSNLAFPLLHALTKAGDPIAKKVFKEEIAKRISSGNEKIIEFLVNERYIDFLEREQYLMSLLNPAEAEILIKLEKFTDQQFTQIGRRKYFDSGVEEYIYPQFMARNKSVSALLIYWYNKPPKPLPEWICNLKNLEIFHYFGDNIPSLPKHFSKLKNLKELAVDSEILEKISSSITQLPHLEELYIKSGLLKTIPENIGDLKKLKIFSVGNMLTTLPESITKLKELEYLYINHNRLCQLPESLYSLKSLKELNIKNNSIEEISESISELKNLEVFIIKKNKIRTLPESLLQLKKLRILFIDNEIIEKNKDIIKKLETNGVMIS